MLKAGRWHRQLPLHSVISRSRHSRTVCRLISVLRTRHTRRQNIPFWDDRLTADAPRATDDSYPVRPQSGCGHIASGHKQKADQTMISTTCCYYYVLYICLVGWYAAGISPWREKKKRNCFQFYYSNSPLTKSSPSELYHAFLLLANYVCDVPVSQAIRERKLRAMWSFGATFGSNYPLFLKSNFHRGPSHHTKTTCLWPASMYRVMFNTRWRYQKSDSDDNKKKQQSGSGNCQTRPNSSSKWKANLGGRFKSSEMWRCVFTWAFPDVSKSCAFDFRALRSDRNRRVES